MLGWSFTCLAVLRVRWGTCAMSVQAHLVFWCQSNAYDEHTSPDGVMCVGVCGLLTYS